MSIESEEQLRLLQVVTHIQSERKIINDAIEALTEYKESGLNEDSVPFVQCIMVIMKWEQAGKSLQEIMSDTDKKIKTIDKVVQEEEWQEAKDILKNDLNINPSKEES